GSVLDVQALTLKDEYRRRAGGINVGKRSGGWLGLGTRTEYSDEDRSRASPVLSGGDGLYRLNPLPVPSGEDGKPAISAGPEAGPFGNPLEPLLYSNQDETHQFLTNNFISVDVPCVPGRSNRVNVGLRMRLGDYANYMGRDTRFG